MTQTPPDVRHILKKQRLLENMLEIEGLQVTSHPFFKSA